jgi:hypothetical protein
MVYVIAHDDPARISLDRIVPDGPTSLNAGAKPRE